PMNKSVIDDATVLAPEKVFSLFLSREEIGTTDQRGARLELAFNAVWKTYNQLRERVAQARTARGELVQGGPHGTMWQRDRAFLVSLVRLERTKAQLERELAELQRADKIVRGERPTFQPDEQVLISNNLRCSYELYEA